MTMLRSCSVSGSSRIPAKATAPHVLNLTTIRFFATSSTRQTYAPERRWPELRTAISSTFDERRTRSASSINNVGLRASISRNTAAAVMELPVSGRGTRAPMTSRRVVLPHCLSGD